jgi:hypothetical protein
VKLRLESGEDAEARAFDGGQFTLWSPRAFAPGAPVRFVARFDEGERPLEGRALGSKRIDEHRFEVRVRFVNLRRDDRQRLLKRLDSQRFDESD